MDFNDLAVSMEEECLVSSLVDAFLREHGELPQNWIPPDNQYAIALIQMKVAG